MKHDWQQHTIENHVPVRFLRIWKMSLPPELMFCNYVGDWAMVLGYSWCWIIAPLWHSGHGHYGLWPVYCLGVCWDTIHVGTVLYPTQAAACILMFFVYTDDCSLFTVDNYTPWLFGDCCYRTLRQMLSDFKWCCLLNQFGHYVSIRVICLMSYVKQLNQQ
jgi:hypothetical protein